MKYVNTHPSGVQKCGRALAPRNQKLGMRERDLQRSSSACPDDPG